MRHTVIGLICWALSQSNALADQLADAYARCGVRHTDDYLDVIRTRAFTVQPPHRAGPVRYLNISDDEVREVQAAASEVVGNVLVTIAEVTEKCPCEDGDACTDQVWVWAYKPSGTVGLLLSKVDGHWTIGAVQRWWLSHENLQEHKFKGDYFGFKEAERDLLWQFPKCGLDKQELAWIDKEYDECELRAEKAAREHP